MIGCFNTDVELIKKLNASVIDEPMGLKYHGVFLEWMKTTSDPKMAPFLLKQTLIIETCVKKKIPLVIFDGDRTMTKKEAEWLKKSNVYLFEPAVINRDGFKYMPFWLEIIDTYNDMKLNEDKRNVNLGYIGNISDKTSPFESYFLSVKKTNDDMCVKYCSSDVLPEKELEYDKLDIQNTKLSYSDIEYTVILGNKNDYTTGYLDKSFIKALKNYCVPFIPKENRFYNAFPCVVDYKLWISFFKDMYSYIYLSYIFDIHECIKERYPEFDINYTVDVIKNCFKK
jgi:hypothetical protein